MKIKRIGIYKMDFLSFKTFISTEALIGFYYLGAIILPIFSINSGDSLLNQKIKQLPFTK